MDQQGWTRLDASLVSPHKTAFSPLLDFLMSFFSGINSDIRQMQLPRDYIYMNMYVWRETETETDRQTDRQTQRDRDRERQRDSPERERQRQRQRRERNFHSNDLRACTKIKIDERKCILAITP